MATSNETKTNRAEEAKSQKSQLFIIDGGSEGPFGPDRTDLALSWAERGNPLLFPVQFSDGLRIIEGAVVGLDNIAGSMEKDVIPAWAQPRTITYWCRLRLRPRSSPIHPSKFLNRHFIEMLYCSGPKTEDRWGIFAIGSMKAAIDEVKKNLIQVFSNSDEVKGKIMTILGSGRNSYSIFIGFVGPAPGSPNSPEKFPWPFVRLDLRAWALSTRTSDNTGGKWEHRRIAFYPYEYDKIIGEACAAFKDLMKKEKNDDALNPDTFISEIVASTALEERKKQGTEAG